MPRVHRRLLLAHILELACRAALRRQVNEKVLHQFYPIFDLRDGRRPLLKMCWDLTNHLDPDRTFLEFQAQSVKPVPAGEGECNFGLESNRANQRCGCL